jgi:MATE family multidrug resistance protein
MKTLFSGSVPVTVTMIVSTAESLSIMYFINDYTSDPNVYNGYSLASAFLMLLSFAVVLALSGGMMARISQAFGQKDYNLCGLYFHRGTIINLIVSLPFLIPMFFTKEILISFGSNQEEAEIAQIYLNYRFPGTIATTFYLSLVTAFNACQSFKVPGYLQAFGTLIGIGLSALFTLGFGWGVTGVAIAYSVSWVACLVLLTVYTKIWSPKPFD